LLDDVGVGASVSFEVEAEGETHQVEVAKGRCPGVRRSLFGISIVEPFPFGIAIESDDVGGPSAGLMWALGLYDLLTPDDLTRGRTIAGTGEIDGDGDVLPIGAIDDKVIGAREAGADILLVPRRNARQIADADTGGMRVIPVATFDDALRALGAPEPAA
jgi:PDZ domain-containing protein